MNVQNNRDEHIRRTRLVQASQKTSERLLNRYGHEMRRRKHLGRKVPKTDTLGKWKNGHRKTR